MRRCIVARFPAGLPALEGLNQLVAPFRRPDAACAHRNPDDSRQSRRLAEHAVDWIGLQARIAARAEVVGPVQGRELRLAAPTPLPARPPVVQIAQEAARLAELRVAGRSLAFSAAVLTRDRSHSPETTTSCTEMQRPASLSYCICPNPTIVGVGVHGNGLATRRPLAPFPRPRSQLRSPQKVGHNVLAGLASRKPTVPSEQQRNVRGSAPQNTGKRVEASADATMQRQCGVTTQHRCARCPHIVTSLRRCTVGVGNRCVVASREDATTHPDHGPDATTQRSDTLEPSDLASLRSDP